MNMAVMKRLNRQGFLIAGLHLLVMLNLAADFYTHRNQLNRKVNEMFIPY